jgi:hypothetical protein
LIFDLYDLEGVRQLDGLVADQMIKELYGKKFDKSRTALEYASSDLSLLPHSSQTDRENAKTES